MVMNHLLNGMILQVHHFHGKKLQINMLIIHISMSGVIACENPTEPSFGVGGIFSLLFTQRPGPGTKISCQHYSVFENRRDSIVFPDTCFN